MALTIVVFLVACWIYLPSITRYRELKLEEEKINKRIREIDTQIKALTDERALLQKDVTYLEKVIREELGFVKPGEIVYELVTKKNLANSPATPPVNVPTNNVAKAPLNAEESSSVLAAPDTSVSINKAVVGIATAKKNTSSKKTNS